MYANSIVFIIILNSVVRIHLRQHPLSLSLFLALSLRRVLENGNAYKRGQRDSGPDACKFQRFHPPVVLYKNNEVARKRKKNDETVVKN